MSNKRNESGRCFPGSTFIKDHPVNQQRQQYGLQSILSRSSQHESLSQASPYISPFTRGNDLERGYAPPSRQLWPRLMTHSHSFSNAQNVSTFSGANVDSEGTVNYKRSQPEARTLRGTSFQNEGFQNQTQKFHSIYRRRSPNHRPSTAPGHIHGHTSPTRSRNDHRQLQNHHKSKDSKSFTSIKSSASNSSKNRESNKTSDSLQVCYKSDFLHNCGISWLELLSVYDIGEIFGMNGKKRSFLVSDKEPVITFALNLESNPIPHFHITSPLYRNPNQIGRQILPKQLPVEIARVEGGFNFSVFSYNVLSDDLLWQNRTLYQTSPEWTLKWQYRKNNLMKEIITCNADIICLQEVQENHYHHWFLPNLKKNGYTGIYKQRSGRKTDGCAVFFRECRFRFKECRAVEYKIPQHALMDRDNIGLVVALCPIEESGRTSKPPIFIANTHLLFNQNRGDIKLLQLAMLFAEIDDMANDSTEILEEETTDIYNPIIVCGDMNSKPLSPLYEFLVKGRLRFVGAYRKYISGQNSMPTGKNSKSGPILQDTLIPEEMGISNLCQKIRKCDEQLDSTTEANNKRTRSSVSCREIPDCFVVNEKVENKTQVLEETGVLKHLLQLQSAHRFEGYNGNALMTSTQGVVDYILFSQGKKQMITQSIDGTGDIFVNVQRHQLYLTGVLSLLTEKDMSALQSFPNPFVSSDHLALLANFRLF